MGALKGLQDPETWQSTVLAKFKAGAAAFGPWGTPSKRMEALIHHVYSHIERVWQL